MKLYQVVLLIALSLIISDSKAQRQYRDALDNEQSPPEIIVDSGSDSHSSSTMASSTTNSDTNMNADTNADTNSNADSNTDSMVVSHRSLQAATCGPNYFYKTNIGMDSDTTIDCSTQELTIIGAELNKAYDDVVDIDQAISDLQLNTQVCTVAKTAARRALQQQNNKRPSSSLRELAVVVLKYKYNWAGSGFCRLCPKDDGDLRGRKMSMKEQNPHPQQRDLREAYSVIDFNTDGSGKKLTNQDYVQDNWHAKYGLNVTVELANSNYISVPPPTYTFSKQRKFDRFATGYAPDQKARIFDTANVTAGNWDLGSPNVYCPVTGPGYGAGGSPQEEGENCIPQGNVLIIQKSNKLAADANIVGGTIVFSFASPTRVGHIALMNVDDESAWIEIVTFNGKDVRIDFDGLGINSIKTIHIDLVVKKLKVVLKSYGAVTELGIFTPTTAKQALSDTARSYIRNKNPFAELIPYLEFDLSYYLTRHINSVFGANSTSCLYRKWVTIDVQMEAVPKLPPACLK